MINVWQSIPYELAEVKHRIYLDTLSGLWDFRSMSIRFSFNILGITIWALRVIICCAKDP